MNKDISKGSDEIDEMDWKFTWALNSWYFVNCILSIFKVYKQHVKALAY